MILAPKFDSAFVDSIIVSDRTGLRTCVVFLHSSHHQLVVRELGRRKAKLEHTVMLVSGGVSGGRVFDAVLLEPRFEGSASESDRYWLETMILPRLSK